MKAEQVSFAAGEINPLLHARVDLSRYRIALAELVNMIVLPQGGVTRRAGLRLLRQSLASGVRLIPFEYNRTDSAILEFGNKTMRVWRGSSGSYLPSNQISTPYALADVKDLRYVQSGNVMFLTHRNYKPYMLVRNSLTSWTFKELKFSGGPWIDGEEWASGVELELEGTGRTRIVRSAGGNVFSSGHVGTLLKVEYAVKPKLFEIESSLEPDETISPVFEVKGTMNITTSGEWRGIISVERSADGGITWITMRQYVRKDTETQGQWDFTLSETEEGILYRVRAQHDELREQTDKVERQVVGTISLPVTQVSYSGEGSSGDSSGDSGSNEPQYKSTIYLTDWLARAGDYYKLYDLTEHLTGNVYYSPTLNETFYLKVRTGKGAMTDPILGYIVSGDQENLAPKENDDSNSGGS